MTMVTLPLEYGKFYHIFNRGINSCNLFSQAVDYEHFLRLYEKYIPLVAETSAWVLMPNHFHLLIRVKDEDEILPFPDITPLPQSGSSTSKREMELEPPSYDRSIGKRKPIPSHQLGHLFNAYCQHYNARYGRHGSLFERQFHRKLVNSEAYFIRLVVYIHHNPVHHGFCKHPLEYPWSSYNTVLSDMPTKVMREAVLDRFGGRENFISQHKQQLDLGDIESYLGFTNP